MKIFSTANHHLHHPEFELFNGDRITSPEVPERVENILSTLSEAGYEVNFGDEPRYSGNVLKIVSNIHSEEYLHWFQNAQITERLYPSVFNTSGKVTFSGHSSIQWGNFVTDTFTPLLPQTWQVAFSAAALVYAATQLTLSTGETSIAVVRPPGHHAGRSRVGGYCYLNNAAVAAELLSTKGKVAILDIDYHHGNGTQDIFYTRQDVVTCSIHADPSRKFPYFLGFELEAGEGEGIGSNRNYPLAAGITDDQYQLTLEKAVSWIKKHKVDYLIISLGLDTHESDPICDFNLTTKYYKRMAQTIRDVRVPTVVVLEGGYSTSAIGENILSFLTGLQENK